MLDDKGDIAAFHQGLSILDHYLAANANDADALAERGHLHMQLDQFADAIADFDKAASLGCKLNRIYSWRGFCYMKQHQYQKGIDDLSAAIRLHTIDFWDFAKPQDYTNRALAYKKVGKPELAEKDMLDVAMLNKVEEARLIRVQGQIQKAEYLLNEAVNMSPDKPSAWMFRGIIHNNEREFWKAIADLTRVLQMVPDFPPALYFRADSYEELGEHQRAIDDYSRLIELKPHVVAFRYVCETGRLREHFEAIDWEVVNVADIYYLRAKCKTNLGLTHEAIEDLDTAIKLCPSDKVACSLRADMMMTEGRSKKALDDYAKAIKLGTKDWKAYYQRASAFEKLGQFEDAIRDYSQIIAQNPEEAGAYLLRARLYDKLGKHSKALADYTRIIRINSEDDDAYRCRGQTNFILGNYQAAVDDLTRALEMDSGNAQFVYEYRAKCYRALGKKDLAEADEKKTVDTQNEQVVPTLKKISLKQVLFFASLGVAGLALIAIIWVAIRVMLRRGKN